MLGVWERGRRVVGGRVVDRVPRERREQLCLWRRKSQASTSKKWHSRSSIESLFQRQFSVILLGILERESL